MADLLQTGVAKLASVIKAGAASEVTYTRGGYSVDMDATLGESRFEQVDTEGFVTRIESQDFIVTAADLILNGETVLPQRGDTIQKITDGVTRDYDVLPVDGEKCYRLTRGVLLRIHTKQLRVT